MSTCCPRGGVLLETHSFYFSARTAPALFMPSSPHMLATSRPVRLGKRAYLYACDLIQDSCTGKSFTCSAVAWGQVLVLVLLRPPRLCPTSTPPRMRTQAPPRLRPTLLRRGPLYRRDALGSKEGRVQQLTATTRQAGHGSHKANGSSHKDS